MLVSGSNPEIQSSRVAVAVGCEHGDWFVHFDDNDRTEAVFVECDPLLLEFSDVLISNEGNQTQCRIYVTD